METLKRRADFLAVAGGKKVSRPGFLLQARQTGGSQPARFGFTVTRKIGNAAVRNRIRRRLREAVRTRGEAAAMPGIDYVLVGRRAALTLEFQRLVDDLMSGLAALSQHQGAEDKGRKSADDR